MFQNLSSRVKAVLTMAVVLAAFIGSVVGVVIADRAKTSSLYNGPAACPLVGTEDLLRLGNPPGSTLLLDEGVEADVKRIWTEESTTRRRTTTKVDRRRRGRQDAELARHPCLRVDPAEMSGGVVRLSHRNAS